MTYELAAAAWLGTISIIVSMSKGLWGNLRRQFDDFAGEIKSKNADLGLDYSVDAEDIALDYLTPLGAGILEKYAKQNGVPRDHYVSELKEGVGRPYRLALSAALLVAIIVVAFSGPVVFRLWGLSPAGEYFAALYALILANLTAYFLL
jgi:hypothetical protein